MFEDYPDVVDINGLCKMLGGISRKLAYRMLINQKIRSARIGCSYKTPQICKAICGGVLALQYACASI